ncbi:MAG TPA: heterodisulfide reductase-related iron-sulfur binding cluster, partial [Beijerinckiaceae bacterium]|nr:heterodisulfide reductase-related iron-sulfur binding cluster [Beijerinckiaceae bacterium]
MLGLAPARLPNRTPTDGPGVHAPPGPRKGRVALLSGCAQSVLAPGINDAAIRLVTRHGYEVIVPRNEGCCGALVHHMGREHESHEQARRMIDLWTAEIANGGLDAILITASGCGTTIKDYGFMFRDDPAYADKAARVAALAMDITEFAAKLDLSVRPGPGLTVAYHSACSMQHGQKITDLPKTLLRQAGFTVKDVPEGHICCGSAGTYNMLQPEISGSLRARKVTNIERTGAPVIATGNLGCMTQIAKGFEERGETRAIVHTVELLDWATGGPKPEGLG